MLIRKGQSTVEYALIIAVVVAGLLLMQHYIKRGYAGKLKESSDDMGEQFDPSAYTATYTKTKTSEVNEVVTAGGVTTTTHTADKVDRTTKASEAVAAWGRDDDLYAR